MREVRGRDPPAELAALLGVTDVRADHLEPHWNVAPTMDVPAVAVGRDGERRLGAFRWGLVPSWSKDAKGGARMINARAETLTEKPAFRTALQRRRCLLPADGFYEWLRVGTKKQPYFVRRANGAPMVFAGLWDVWRDPADPDAELLRTCAVITTTANSTLSPIHDRMPVVLEPSGWDRWLDREVKDPAAVLPLLAPADDHVLVRTAVSPDVNSVRNDRPDLLRPVEA